MKWNGKNKSWYVNKGYSFTKLQDLFLVKVEDLTAKAKALVQVKCDNCGKILENVKWTAYKKCVHEDGKYYCRDCGTKLFGKEKGLITKLLDSESFYDWCYRSLNKEQADEIMKRWDYELNKRTPKDVFYGTGKKYYFKCSRDIHPSELHNIHSFSSKKNSLKCKQCNSFYQWCIDHNKQDVLDRWDYELNNCSPKDVTYSSMGVNKKGYWFKCPRNLHPSELKNIHSFVSGYNGTMDCNKCNSLGQYIIDNYGQEFLHKVWSKKNKKSYFEYSYGSNQYAWFKCLDGKHKDFYRIINDVYSREFRCPECQYSKGEKRIEEWLILNGFIKTTTEEYILSTKNNKLIENKYYIPQKEFDGLLGLGNGNLSYDFYLPKHNILIEYQGEQHEKYIKGLHKSKKDFEKQQEHDKRKAEYCNINKIILLPIWYWDYDNIESILNKTINT